MRYCVIIPAHNEEQFIEKTLSSLLQQTVKAQEIIVVNDNSTDGTQSIVEAHIGKTDNLSLYNHNSSQEHLPGSKVVNAFYQGFDRLQSEWDIIVKLDADLILPVDYFERVIKLFENAQDRKYL